MGRLAAVIGICAVQHATGGLLVLPFFQRRLPSDVAVALALAFAPIVVVTVLVGAPMLMGFPAAAGVYAVLVLVAARIALKSWSDGFLSAVLRNRAVCIWLWTLLLWSAQAALVACQDFGGWGGDWNDAYLLGRFSAEAIAAGQMPLWPHNRTTFNGVWATPSLWVTGDYWAYLLAVLWVHSVAVMPVYLAGRLWGGRQGGRRAAVLFAIAPGIATSSIYGWPKIGAAGFVLLGLVLIVYRRAVAGGLALFMATQVHLSSVLYAAPLSIYAVCRRHVRAFAVFFLCGAAWLVWIYGHGWSPFDFNVYTTTTSDRTLAEHFQVLQDNVMMSFWPEWDVLNNTRVDDLIHLVDYVIPNIPLAALAGILFWRPRQSVVWVSILGGTLLAFVIHEPPGHLAQNVLAPLALLALAAGGAGARVFRAPMWRFLLLLSLVQFLFLRGIRAVPTAVMCPHPNDVAFFREVYPRLVPVAFPLIALALWRLLVAAWRA